MNSKIWSAVAAAALSITALAGCSTGAESEPEPTAIGGDVIAPVTMGVNELQGAEVDLQVGQVLNIDTESLAIDSYTGVVDDPAVAEFVQGHDDGSAEFNPGVTGLAPGSTEVTLTNEQGGIEPLTFTVTVT